MAILWPAFALFALTLFVVVRLGSLRWRAVGRRQVDPRFYKIYRGEGEPEEVAVVSRHLVNLYEAPTLFYAGTAIAFAAGAQLHPSRFERRALALSCLCAELAGAAGLLGGPRPGTREAAGRRLDGLSSGCPATDPMSGAFLKSLTFGVFIAASIGPIALLIIGTAACRGLRLGSFAALGAALADLAHALLAFSAGALILPLLEAGAKAIRNGSALVLIVFAIAMIRRDFAAAFAGQATLAWQLLA